MVCNDINLYLRDTRAHINPDSKGDYSSCSSAYGAKILLGILTLVYKFNREIYFEGTASRIVPIYDWSISIKKLNKQRHALNGNTEGGGTTSINLVVDISEGPVFGPDNDFNVYVIRQTSQYLVLYCQSWTIRMKFFDPDYVIRNVTYRPELATMIRSTQRTFRDVLGFGRYGFSFITEEKVFFMTLMRDAVGYNWAICSRDRNAATHATHGNIKGKEMKKSKFKYNDANYYSFIKSYERLTKSSVKHWFENDSDFKLSSEGLRELKDSLDIFKCDMSTERHIFMKTIAQFKTEEKMYFRETGKLSHYLSSNIDVCMLLFYNNYKYIEFLNCDIEDETPDYLRNPIVDLPQTPKLCATIDNFRQLSNVSVAPSDYLGSPSPIKSPLSVDIPENFSKIESSKNYELNSKNKCRFFTFSPHGSKQFTTDFTTPVESTPKMIVPVKWDRFPVIPNSIIDVARRFSQPSESPSSDSDDEPSPQGPIFPYNFEVNSYSSRFLCNPHLYNGGTIELFPDSVAVRSFDVDVTDVKVGKFVKANKIFIKNESISSFFRLLTPDFISTMTDKELYFHKSEEEIWLPIDFYDYSVKFWNGRSFTDVDLTLFRLDVVKYSARLALQHDDYQNLVLFGPTIGMYFYHSSLVQLHPLVRQARQSFKLLKFSKVCTWVSNLFKGLKCIVKGLSQIKPSVTKVVVTDNIGFTWKPITFLQNLYPITCHIPTPTIAFKSVSLFGIKLFSYPTILTTHTVDVVNQYKLKFLFDGTSRIQKFVFDFLSYIKKFSYLDCIIQLPSHYFFMFSSLPSIFDVIGTIVINPVSCIISPILEEYDRSLLSTCFYIIVETIYSGSFVTLPLHVLNFILSRHEFKGNLYLRIFLHCCFNILSINCASQCASSMLSSLVYNTINYISGKCKKRSVAEKNFLLWESCPTIKMVTYPTEVKSSITKNKGIIDVGFVRKENLNQLQYIVGPHDNGYLPIAFSQNKVNEFAALNARVMKDTPTPNKTTLREFFLWVKRNYKRIFPHTSHVKEIRPLNWQDYLVKSNAAPGVKMKLQRQFEEFDKDNVTCYDSLPKKSIKKWCFRESFVKTENLNYQTPLGVLDKAPRLIQGGKKQFICLVGPWIAALQNHIKHDWNKHNFICFTSGVEAQDAAKLVTKYPVWMEDDVSAWDASLCPKLLEVELWLFRKFGAPQACYDLMAQNINTIGMTSFGLFYYRKGCRKSGDPYTSLGNSILNALIHLFIFCRFHRIGIREARNRMTMLVQGDDSLLNLSTIDSINWKQEMSLFGFKSIGTYKENIDNVEFCSSRVYKTNTSVTFGPIPGKVIGKFGVFCNPPKDINPYDIMYGSAVGLSYSSCNVPILNEFVNKMIDLSDNLRLGNCNIKYKKRLNAVNYGLHDINQPWRMLHKQQGIDISTLDSMVDKYSYSSWMGFRLKQEVDLLTTKTSMFPKILQYVVDHDTSGPFLYLRDNEVSPSSLMF